MKKQVIIALSLAIGSFSFAQKKELKAAEKAIKGNNFAEAKAALDQAESFLSAMDNKLKDKFYYFTAQASYANGAGSLEDFDKAIESLEKIQISYKEEVPVFKTDITNALLKKGNEFYDSQDYSSASKYFEGAYNSSTKDTTYLYYAAASAVNVQEFDRALKLYVKLKELGYTGIAKQYYATNKETGKEEIFDERTRDFYVKGKTHINPGERVTKSKKAEIVKNIALIYVSNGENEKALEAMKAARSESPDDIDLILSEASVHQKMGNSDKFKELLDEAVKLDPENKDLHYNIGVVNMNSNNSEEARKSFKKVISLDPTHSDSVLNLSSLLIEDANLIVEEMGKLGMSKADDIKYEELRGEKDKIFNNAVDFLVDFINKNDNAPVEIFTQLKNIYSALGKTEKVKETQEKIDSLTN